MAQATFGTGSFSGLNIGTAADKIADHELQESKNGWTDKDGVWSTARGPQQLYSGYSDISCFAAGRMDGSTHQVWMDGNTLYDNGVNVGTITAGTSMKIIDIGNAFLILGAAVNYIYDGDHVREHGCWQPDDIQHLYLQKETPSVHGTNITAVTKAAPGVVTLVAHGYETGDWVYLDSLTEMTELNGRKFLVTKVDADNFSINEDTSDHGTAESSATGTAKRYAGLEGAYKWYLTCTVELSDGRVLESRPRGLRLGDEAGTGGTDVESWEADEITMAATDLVFIGQSDIKQYGLIRWIDDSVQNFKISGTIGTDYFPGMRIYRTKADGTDFYLEREYRHGDTNLFFTGTTDQGYFFYHDGTGDGYGSVLGASDVDLGAVYTASATDHSNPPVSSMAAKVGQRLFVNDVDNPERYHWSHLDGIEYYTELGWNTIEDTITLMEPLDNALVLASQDRILYDRFIGGIPDLREIRTDTGSKTGIATTTDDGVLMLESDGLWLFDGVRTEKVSRRAIDQLDSPASICSTKDTTYMSGLYDSFVVRTRDGGKIWHGGDGTYALSSASGGAIYAASDHDIVEMFEGARTGGTLVTKAWNFGLDDVVSAKVKLDIEGSSVPSVWVDGNRQDADAPSHASSTDNIEGKRRLVWVYIKRLVNHVAEIKLEASGELHVYGAWLEVER